MKKFLLLTLTSFVFLGASLLSGYFYLQGLSIGQNPWYLLFVVLICISFAAFCMLKASTIKNPFFTSDLDDTPPENDPSIATTSLKSTIERQNSIISEWRKTNHIHDKMKMINVSTSSSKE